MGEDRPQTSRQRVTVAQAAEILGVTVEAIRGRIKRKTLEHERHSGTVYVLLDADQSTNRTRPDNDQTTDRLQSTSDALTSELRDRLRYVEGQLEAERQAHAEARRLLAAALERIPAIEAPSGHREASVGSTADERAVSQDDASAANVVRVRRYSVDPLTMLLFAAGVGAVVSFANPLLISRMDNLLWWLALLLWILPPVFGVWLGRSHVLSEADALDALREERLSVRDNSDEAASLDARIRYRESRAGDLGMTTLHAIFAGLATVLPGAAVSDFYLGIDTWLSLVVGGAQGFLVCLFVLSGTYIGAGLLVRRQGEEAHQNAVSSVSAARSAGTNQAIIGALIGFAGTIIAAVLGLIGTLINSGG